MQLRKGEGEGERGGGGGEGRGRSPMLFFENGKKCPDFGKRGLNYVHLWVESSIQNLVWRVSWRKALKFFAVGPFFCVFDETFIEVS